MSDKPKAKEVADERLPNPEPVWVRETAEAEIKALREENSALKEENAKLKGEPEPEPEPTPTPTPPPPKKKNEWLEF